METFLKLFVAWCYANGVMPPEIKDTDVSGEDKTFLMNFPPDSNSPVVNNCVVIRQYNSKGSPNTGNDAITRFIQVIFRNTVHTTAASQAEALFQFLKFRPDDVDILNDDTQYWAVIVVDRGTDKLDEDAQGRYQHSLSFQVTTKS